MVCDVVLLVVVVMLGGGLSRTCMWDGGYREAR